MNRKLLWKAAGEKRSGLREHSRSPAHVAAEKLAVAGAVGHRRVAHRTGAVALHAAGVSARVARAERVLRDRAHARGILTHGSRIHGALGGRGVHSHAVGG